MAAGSAHLAERAFERLRGASGMRPVEEANGGVALAAEPPLPPDGGETAREEQATPRNPQPPGAADAVRATRRVIGKRAADELFLATYGLPLQPVAAAHVTTLLRAASPAPSAPVPDPLPPPAPPAEPAAIDASAEVLLPVTVAPATIALLQEAAVGEPPPEALAMDDAAAESAEAVADPAIDAPPETFEAAPPTADPPTGAAPPREVPPREAPHQEAQVQEAQVQEAPPQDLPLLESPTGHAHAARALAADPLGADTLRRRIVARALPPRRRRGMPVTARKTPVRPSPEPIAPSPSEPLPGDNDSAIAESTAPPPAPAANGGLFASLFRLHRRRAPRQTVPPESATPDTPLMDDDPPDPAAAPPAIEAAAAETPPAPARGTLPALRRAAPGDVPSARPLVDSEWLDQAGLVFLGKPRSRVSDEIRIAVSHIYRSLHAAASGAQTGAQTGAQSGVQGASNLIMVTSARPGEGKSFISLNLAGAMALHNAREVLLIDTDAKQRPLSYELGLADAPGILDMTRDPSLRVEDLIVPTSLPNLSILPIGTRAAECGDMIPARPMSAIVERVARRFSNRIVMLDTPPCLATSDPSEFAPVVGQVIMVVEAQKTRRGELEAALDLVATCPTIMLLLNNIVRSTGAASGGYHYFGTYS